MENVECSLEFETQKDKIRTVFSTPFILHCVKNGNVQLYDDILFDVRINKLLQNDEIIKTAQAFMQNDLNLSTASKACFLHRNTMIYRITKICEVTGLNIRKFQDAVLFSNMLQIFNSRV